MNESERRRCKWVNCRINCPTPEITLGCMRFLYGSCSNQLWTCDLGQTQGLDEMSSSAASTSYSALLRRSKLASYHPSTEQVYTAPSSSLSRSTFGLKRPLPSSVRSKAPLLRLTALDTPQRHTSYRQATREAVFTKKFAQARQGLNVQYHSNKDLLSPVTEVQSRFVAKGQRGSTVEPKEGGEMSHSLGAQAHNVLSLPSAEFEALVSSLGSRRDEFVQFLRDEQATYQSTTSAPAPSSSAPIDLFEHAQQSPSALHALVDLFLRRHPPTSLPSPSETLKPLLHPALALQYSQPTPLESHFSAPLPGRLLTPSTAGNFQSDRPANSKISLLGQISAVTGQFAAGLTPTTFFPDAAGVRSNVPGRMQFRVSPQINAAAYRERLAQGEAFLAPVSEERGGRRLSRGSGGEGTTTPMALDNSMLNFGAVPVQGGWKAQPALGTQAHSAVSERTPGRGRSSGRMSGEALGFDEMMSGGSSPYSLPVKSYMDRPPRSVRAANYQKREDLKESIRQNDAKMQGRSWKKGGKGPQAPAPGSIAGLVDLLASLPNGDKGNA